MVKKVLIANRGVCAVRIARTLRRMQIRYVVVHSEADAALLSDASRCEALFGPPPVEIEEMLDYVASWVAQGGRSLGRPTHYESREGRY